MSTRISLDCIIERRVKDVASYFRIAAQSNPENTPKEGKAWLLEKGKAKFSHISKSKAILLNSTSFNCKRNQRSRKQSFWVKDNYKSKAFVSRESTSSLSDMLMQNGAKCKYQERVCRAVFQAYLQIKTKQINPL